ncbi:putative zinc metalloprotease [Trichodelitschia bisporula]|uniref:Peptide hydrolase n=1 Tax=Trichodelitschia bisporula TaxID=703511 RepID=A0A6G1I6D6_9PEZI|nr:putative zinc metalloprotease [Trichodelitschia bisporula]
MVRLTAPFGFTPWPVSVFITATYVALLVALVSLHNVVPHAPKKEAPLAGVNMTEAWRDLQHLSGGFHPYNSRRNDEVRDWLLLRIEAILARNNATWDAPLDHAVPSSLADSSVHIYNDLTTNLTFSSRDSDLSVAYTGTNIIVYIRGTEDGKPDGKAPVLVNAHYDSVPSGYGATDDGVGVITVLQLISYFSAPGHQPKRGVMALLNNGEEDYLNGAYAFSQSPLSKLPHTFLNLEGAGAGGRAVLFRSTDTEVTKFYKKSPHPFGTVISADGFKRHLVRSDTDYTVFHGELGMRGLDVAFMEPRARYHTIEDSTRFTSVNSIWHMLSAAVATMDGLTSDTSSSFDGEPAVAGGVSSGTGSDGVWFDLFGQSFAVFKLHTLFAISVTLLVVTPLILIALTVILAKCDKLYLFSGKKLSPEGDIVHLNGWRGFFRFPITVTVASAAVVGLGFLLAKINPYIVYSSEYAVWSMMITAWTFVAWFLSRGADAMRPSALHRTYALIWLYIFAYAILAADAVAQNNFKLAGGYFLVIYFAAVFTALFIGYLELFALAKKSDYLEELARDSTDGSTILRAGSETVSPPRTSSGISDGGRRRDAEDDDAGERTSLLRGDRHRTYAGYHSYSRSVEDSQLDLDCNVPRTWPKPYAAEQGWSGHLLSWIWLLQFLVLGPVPIIFLTQVGLFTTAALNQTPSDGSSVLTIYLAFAIISVLLLIPILPFLHRFAYTLPALLFLVCIATTLYNLVAFPFSAQSRLKVYFIQRVNFDTGSNEVSLTGLSPYVEDIIKTIPSAAGQHLVCSGPDYSARSGLTKCAWEGIPPNIGNGTKLPGAAPPLERYTGLVEYNVTRVANSTRAVFHISGQDTRACRLLFDRPIKDFTVAGFASDPRFPRVGRKGCSSIRLWNREWGAGWTVDVEWEGEGGLDGRVVCLWSDANDPATIPALAEVQHYMPVWSIPTKLSDGLVEGFKVFKV